MKMKRMMVMLLGLCLLLSCAPAVTLAAETIASGSCGKNVDWILDAEGTLTIYGEGETDDWAYTGWEYLLEPWLRYEEDILSVVVEEGVTHIGDYAFSECVNLQQVSLPDTLTSIGTGAFIECESLKSIRIPNSVKEFGHSILKGCSGMTEVWLPDGIQTIPEGFLTGCSALTDFVVPDSVVVIGMKAFESCGKLQQIQIPDSVAAIGQSAFYGCRALTEIVLPPHVTEIDPNTFGRCNALKRVVMPEDLATIHNYAFEQCFALEEIEIPRGVSAIGGAAFKDCTALQNITFYGNAPTFNNPEWVFLNVTATVHYPDNATWTADAKQQYGGTLTWVAYDVSDEAVASGTCGENLTWTLDADGLLTISGEGEMTEYPWKEEYTADITAVVIEEGVTSIRGGAFSNCVNLVTAEVPDTVTSIGPNAFNYCLSLETVNIPAGVVTLGQGVFMDCPGITQIVIPRSVTQIGERAFCYTGLKHVEIPAGVTEIGESAFYGCKTLKDIVFTGNAPTFGTNAFHYVSATAYYPADNRTWTEGAMQSYGGRLTWKAREGTGEPWFGFRGTSVSVWNSLEMDFVVNFNVWDAGVYAVITRNYADGREKDVRTVPGSQWVMLDSNVAYFSYPDIAAKEMGDTLSVVIYDAQGNAVSAVWEDSVRAYAMRMLEKETDAELLTLLVDMLNYGAAAQTQFGYNTENLVNADLTDAQKDYATAAYETESHLVSGTGRYATALTLKSAIMLDFIFSNSAIGTDYTGLYALVTYRDHYGEPVQLRIDAAVKPYDADHGYVSVPGLAVADYSQEVTCKVHNAQGDVIAWAADSIEGYAHRMSGSLPEIVDAIVKFGHSAYNYFH